MVSLQLTWKRQYVAHYVYSKLVIHSRAGVMDLKEFCGHGLPLSAGSTVQHHDSESPSESAGKWLSKGIFTNLDYDTLIMIAHSNLCRP
jgi:hypothetical protein